MSRRSDRREQNRVSSSVFDRRFARLAHRIGRYSHGITPYPRLLKLLLSDLSKDERLQFVPRLFQDPVHWEDVAKRVWRTEKERDKNKFPFLQGDVIQCSHAVGLPGRARLTVEDDAEAEGDKNDIWLVLSPDCDCVRRDLLAVAPAYRVLLNHKREGRMGIYRETAAFARFYRFPVPSLPGDEAGVQGYVADLREPFFLDSRRVSHQAHKRLATMTPPAWHILNAMLFHDLTRADRNEGESVRRTA